MPLIGPPIVPAAMSGERTAAGLGVVAALAVVVLVLAPYMVADARAIGVYYGGLVGPPLAGLFAAVVAIGLAGAIRERTDPATAAGVAVVLGVLTLALLVPWAAGVSPTLVGGMTTVAAFEHHRWGLLAAALVLAAAGTWYAKAVV